MKAGDGICKGRVPEETDPRDCRAGIRPRYTSRRPPPRPTNSKIAADRWTIGSARRQKRHLRFVGAGERVSCRRRRCHIQWSLSNSMWSSFVRWLPLTFTTARAIDCVMRIRRRVNHARVLLINEWKYRSSYRLIYRPQMCVGSGCGEANDPASAENSSLKTESRMPMYKH